MSNNISACFPRSYKRHGCFRQQHAVVEILVLETHPRPVGLWGVERVVDDVPLSPEDTKRSLSSSTSAVPLLAALFTQARCTPPRGAHRSHEKWHHYICFDHSCLIHSTLTLGRTLCVQPGRFTNQSHMIHNARKFNFIEFST